MSEKEETARLKQEISLLREERDQLLESTEDIHVMSNFSQIIQKLEHKGEIIECLLEHVCLVKDLPYASYLEAENGNHRIVYEHVNSEVNSLLGRVFNNSEIPSVIKSYNLNKLCLKGPNNTRKGESIFPNPPEGKSIAESCLIPLRFVETSIGVVLVCDFKQSPNFSDSIGQLLGRLVLIASSRIETLEILRSIETLNVRLRARLSEKKEQLSETQERYRKLIENANDAIFIADAESGLIIDANKKAEALIGRPKSEIIGTNQTELHPKEEAEKYRKLFEEHLRSGRAISDPVFVVNKAGEKIPVEISASVTEIGGKKIIQGNFRDLHERIKTEEALQESEERYRSLFENSIEGIAISKGDEVITANKAVLEMFGYDSVEEFKSIPLLDHVAPESRELILDRIKKRQMGETIYPFFRYKIICKDG
ncbi:MAG: PAS domain-containing protein, partial [Candidatus Hydrothermarchaeales archaeon]